MIYVEKCLYEYKANLAELEVLCEERENLMSLHGNSYEINNSSGEHDPVGNIVNQKFLLDKKILRIKKRVKAVDKLIKDLNNNSDYEKQIAEILKLRYIQHEDKEFVKKELAISEATFWRRVRELIRLAKKYFGFS